MNLFRMLFIFIAFIAINIYLYIRGWQALPAHAGIHTVYTLLFVVASTSVFVAIFAGSRLPVWAGHVLELIGGYWIILFVFILAGALLADLLRIMNHFFGIYPGWVTSNYERSKLLYFLAVLLILAVISIAGYIRFSNPAIKKIDIAVKHESGVKSNLNLIAISDVHLGNLIRKNRLARWVKLINAQKPDVILIVGDLFDHSMRTVELQQMDSELGKLNAQYGVFAIPGNHDYYAGIDHAMKYMKKSGIRVLRDQAVVIDEKLTIIGRDDKTNKNRKTLGSLINGLKSKLPVLVLDHQPSSLTESFDNKIDLHISGHTHNGQIFPFNRVVSKMYDLGYGYRKNGNTHFYVSSGLGLWGAPIRLGTQSEIVRIALKVN